jgi:membrane protease YdiL (CAAX protease family)
LMVIWVDPFAVARLEPGNPEHTREFVKFAVFLLMFEWGLFFIAWIGVRRCGKISVSELMGGKWKSTLEILRDLALGLLTFAGLLAVGMLLQRVLAPYQHDVGAMRAMMPQNRVEALCLLALTVSAGFVEEFVFRGYLQQEFTAITGNAMAATILQVLLFMQGHVYQGLVRLIPVGALGLLLTGVALWRKSLKPGMIGHALGDSLGGILFFVNRL